MNEAPQTFAIVAGRLVTCDGEGSDASARLGAIDDAAIVVKEGKIAWIGRNAELDPSIEVLSVGRPQDSLVTPGLVDCHTHAAYMGSRHAEYAVKMAGGDYEAIAKAGGGIASTQRAVAAASEEEIAAALTKRLRRMAALGVTTCEVKSGYGLVADEELKQLRAIARLGGRSHLPTLVPTFLGLHALPSGVDRDAFVKETVERTLPAVVDEGLARFVDAYVDRNAFGVDEARRLGVAARAAGLGVRLHVGQFADIGGAELAAELGARSADHLEQVGERGIDSLAKAGVTAVLLPVASFTLGQAPPPVALLRRAGVPLAVASDANPGTAPTESLPLALALAVRTYGLTIEEALLGATRWAAASLDESTRGVLRVGSPADLVVWDLPHEAALMQPWGTPRTRLVLRDGAILHHET